jgi:hypothetical protein
VKIIEAAGVSISLKILLSLAALRDSANVKTPSSERDIRARAARRS